jgi:hypothetical protein
VKSQKKVYNHVYAFIFVLNIFIQKPVDGHTDRNMHLTYKNIKHTVVSEDNLFVETGAYIWTASSSTFYSPDRYK